MPMLPFDSGRVRSHAMVSAPSRPSCAEGIEVAFGIAAAAHVLNDHVVSMAREPDGMGVDHGGGDVAAVGLTHQQCGVRAGPGG